MNQEQNNSSKAILIALLVLSVIGNGVLFYMMNKTKTESQNQITQLTDDFEQVSDLKVELEMEYNEALSQIEVLEGRNAVLDSVAAKAKEDLHKNKGYVDNLLRKKKLTEAELAEAQQLIAQIRLERDELLVQVDALAREKMILTEEKEALTVALSSEQQMTAKLTEEKTYLSQKVNLASVIKTTNVQASAVKFRNSGKEVETKRAKAAERIKVCFDLEENKVTEPGSKEFFIRIITPEGGTIAVQQLGSGVFTEAESQTQVPYTSSKIIDYDNSAKSICTYWQQDFAYPAGEYQIELYNLNYKVGTTSLLLK